MTRVGPQRHKKKILRLDAEARKAVRILKTKQADASRTPQGNSLDRIACSCGMCNLGEQ